MGATGPRSLTRLSPSQLEGSWEWAAALLFRPKGPVCRAGRWLSRPPALFLVFRSLCFSFLLLLLLFFRPVCLSVQLPSCVKVSIIYPCLFHLYLLRARHRVRLSVSIVYFLSFPVFFLSSHLVSQAPFQAP